MITKQQKEALSYFRKNAASWARQGVSKSQTQVNIIKQRNDFVLKVVENRKKTTLAIDLGCGSGDLVCAIAAKDIPAIGIDFSKEMIRIAEAKAKKMKCKQAVFQRCSVFDFPIERNSCDVISANGLIEYMAYEELDRLLQLAGRALRRGGSLVLGSRNRLFNLFSLNQFTREEIEGKHIVALLREAISISGAKHLRDLAGLVPVSRQKENKAHKDTGIKVSTRYQFTPVQLANLLQDNGFEPAEISPVHIHGVSLQFKNIKPDVHANISNLLQSYGDANLSLIPQASSFMIHGIKR